MFDRAAELAHGDGPAGGAEAVTITSDLQRPQGDLGAEGRRLGVDPVRSPDHDGVAMRTGQLGHRLQQCG